MPVSFCVRLTNRFFYTVTQARKDSSFKRGFT